MLTCGLAPLNSTVFAVFTRAPDDLLSTPRAIIARATPLTRLQEMAYYSASEVVDLLEEEMTDIEEEPCLEGSDDDLDLSMSDDEERLVHTK